MARFHLPSIPARILLSFAATFFAATAANAAPLLGSGQEVEGLRVYRDSANSRLFYYPPSKLAVALDKAGLPQFSFLQMRYTGSAVTGDRGAFRTRSILSFQVKMEETPAGSMARVKTALRTRFNVEPLLSPLPIRRVTAALNYAPLAGAQTGPVTAPAPAGSGTLEQAAEPGHADGYWTERVFTLAPDDATSQALWETFKKGSVLLSLSYAFYSDGVPPDAPVTQSAGAPDPAKKGPSLVLADTLAITVDAKRYPDRLRQIDVNESVPANYAVLPVACYDFNNDLRPDLQVKVVEIEARGVAGQPVKREVSFSKATPDLCMASVRFPFAVSLKVGYRYRSREITSAGEEKVGPWKEGRPWSQLLDVTTPPDERPTIPEKVDPQ